MIDEAQRKLTNAACAIKSLTDTATYEDLLVYRDWINKELETLWYAQRAEAWSAVCDAIKAYIKEFDRIIINTGDNNCVIIDEHSNFDFSGEVNAPT